MASVLITGVGGGIGKALAEKFLAEGHTVAGTSRGGLSPIANQNLAIYPLDLSVPQNIANCARKLSESGSKFDILVNNAGVLLDDEETVVRVDKLRGTLEVNLIGTVDFTERIIPLMQTGGHIVNISSQAGSLSDVENFTHSHAPLRYPAYKISKAALNMYTRALALRLRDQHIVVSSVHPGWVRTEMGGEEAPVLPEQAAAEIYTFAISRPETGGFWYRGKRFPW